MRSLVFLLTLYVIHQLDIAQCSLCPKGCGRGSCCEIERNNFHCCPYENGVCCADRKSCCPQGSTCDLLSGRCSAYFFHWEFKSLFEPNIEDIPQKIPNYLVCPDEKSTCADNSTCCAMSSDQWGCCEFGQAECCSDGVHCCPAGYKCDLESNQCEKQTHKFTESHSRELPSLIFMSKLATSQFSQTSQLGEKLTVNNSHNSMALSNMAYNGIKCSNSSYTCPDDTSCCLSNRNQWTCCPLPNAVCCTDGFHCCPSGTFCNLKSKECDKVISSDETVKPILLTTYDRSIKQKEIDCDETFSCDDNNTCCETKEADWACCDMPMAVCCSDHENCCPHGTTCDLAHETCNQISGSLAPVPIKKLVKKFFVPPRFGVDYTNTGDGGRINCLDGTQCTTNAKSACCPYPNAVCCSDGKHCCPNGTRCDQSTGQCIDLSSSSSLSVLKSITHHAKSNKVPVGTVATNAGRVGSVYPPITICPNGEFYCANNSTCCLSGKKWNCCPIPNAVCCKDSPHCCPDGTVCDSNRQVCVVKAKKPNQNVVPINEVSLNMCPDGRSYCSQNATCCSLNDKLWGCCALKNAVCCADKSHCCPTRTICNLKTRQCIEPRSKKPDFVVENAFEMTKPDGNSLFYSRPPANLTSEVVNVPVKWCGTCGSTWGCCPTVDGNSWMCCPYVGGVCCNDRKTCCPKHSVCSTDGQCTIVKQDVKYNAPVLVPSKINKHLFSGASNSLFYSNITLAEKSIRAERNILLRFTKYRILKQIHHTICPNALHYCTDTQQCCLSKQHGYTCAPRWATCCSPTKNTYCSNSMCYKDGDLCI